MSGKILTFILTTLCTACTVWQPAPLSPMPEDAMLQRWPVQTESWWGDGRLLLSAGPYRVQSVKTHWAKSQSDMPEYHFRFFDERWLDILRGIEKKTPAVLQQARMRDKFSLQLQAPDGLWQVECRFQANAALARWYEEDPFELATLAANTTCELRDSHEAVSTLQLVHNERGLEYGELKTAVDGMLISANRVPDMPAVMAGQSMPQAVELPYAVEYRFRCGDAVCGRVGLLDQSRLIAVRATEPPARQQLLAVASMTLQAVDILWRANLDEDHWLPRA